MLCAKFDWNWSNGSREEDFKISSMLFHLPLEKRVLHLNKLESPSPKDALCQVWLKLAQYFIIISLWKRAGSFIWTNLNPITQGCYVLSLVEIGTMVLEKMKSLQPDGQTNGRQTTVDQTFSSCELKTMYNMKCIQNGSNKYIG